jgi:PKD repeat protein
MNKRPDIFPENPTTRPNFFRTYCVVFVLLLIALAVIAIPCGAADATDSSDDAVVANQTTAPTTEATTEVTTSPPTTTEVTTEVTTAPTVTATTTQTAVPTTAVTTNPTANLTEDQQVETSTTVGSSATMAGVSLPTAAFSGSPTSGTSPMSVNFVDQSTGSPTGWSWYFGDEAYTTPWTWQASNPWGDEGSTVAAVSLPNGNIVAMAENGDVKNKVWMSTNMGKNWTVQTDNAGWSSQADQPAVALSDGSIVLMTGTQFPNYFSNSVQRSTDQGKTWIRQTGYPDWHQRAKFSAVALSDDSIVLMAGYNPDSGAWVNDVWRSTDKGATWKQQTTDSGFPVRQEAPAVALSDGSIVVMGGAGNTGSSPSKNDVWRSTDQGVTWTRQTASAEWSPRHGGPAVALPDDSILLIGAGNETSSFKEVWRSTDKGKTWVQVPASAEWGQGSSRDSAVVMQDGSVVLVNMPGVGVAYGVWRLETAGSSAQNPTYLYPNEGTYSVALRAYNAAGYTTVLKTGYITLAKIPPTAAFSGSPASGTAPMNVSFTDKSTGNPTGWSWYFGDEPYTKTWTTQTTTPPWKGGGLVSAVSLTDGSIVAFDGYNKLNAKVWRSTDQGKIWTVQTESYKSDGYPDQAVSLSDGSIISIASIFTFTAHDEVLISTDKGKTWAVQNASPGWCWRSEESIVVLSDDSIVLMGGYKSGSDPTQFLNDTWRSTDKGKTWTLQTASAGWTQRQRSASALLSDDSIVLMGGQDGHQNYADTWRSTDKGKTWTLQTASAEWGNRSDAIAAALPDDSIVLMGGRTWDEYTPTNYDVWRSTDKGKTWTQILAHAVWGPQYGQPALILSDGSLVLLGGNDDGRDLIGVWRLETAGSTVQNPAHTYTNAGAYSVVLRAYNPAGYNSTRKTGYITANAPTNVVVFGDTSQITLHPSHMDYSTLGGSSAIRRDGSMETFTGTFTPTGTDWIQATNGAGITTDGNLVTWTSGLDTVETASTASTKKYVAISQYSDWLLAIYEDENGLTHLEARGNYADHPEVIGNVPTGTGWMKIAAGKDHALALRTDGTLVVWGRNDYGQLGLDTSLVYTDIAAGKDFSLGLSRDPASAGTDADTGGNIYAAGNDDSGQVSGAPAGKTTYIQIAAGNATGAVLTTDGHILTWGQNLTGVPTDAGYTDISLASNVGFALKEQGPQLSLTGPISPGQPVQNSNNANGKLPNNLDLEHTHNFVTRVFDPATGNELFWTNDRNVTRAILPNQFQLPVSVIHYVNSSSDVNATVDYQTTVSSPGSSGPTWVNVSEDHWHKESDTMLPRAVCYPDTGCSAGVVADHQVFLSSPVTPTDGAIPVFSVRQLADNSYVGTLGLLGSSQTTTIQMEKNDVDPSQPINFTISSGNLGAKDPGTNTYVTAQANQTNVDSGLNYTITATASQAIPAMNITPQIWRKNVTYGDVLVYTGNLTNCTAATSCVATGDFMPSDNATYYAKATVLYTVPTTVNGVAGTQSYAIVTATDIYPVTAKVTFTSSSYNVNVGDTGTVTMDINNKATVDYYTAYYMKLPPGVTYSSTAKGKNPDGTCNLATSSDCCSVPNFETVWGPGTVLWYWDWGLGDYDKTYIINVAYTTSGTKNFLARDLAEEAAFTLPSWSTDQFNVIVT